MKKERRKRRGKSWEAAREFIPSVTSGPCAGDCDWAVAGATLGCDWVERQAAAGACQPHLGGRNFPGWGIAVGRRLRVNTLDFTSFPPSLPFSSRQLLNFGIGEYGSRRIKSYSVTFVFVLDMLGQVEFGILVPKFITRHLNFSYVSKSTNPCS